MNKNLFSDYIASLSEALKEAEITLKNGRKITMDEAVKKITTRLSPIRSGSDSQVFFIGNGGSSAIASHQAIDYWKNGHIKATAFNDGALLTCLSNDFGYEYVFQKPLERFAAKGDILFAISSSGNSKNIINAVRAARKKRLSTVTLSGFGKDNKLRKCGDINFYVPSFSYGIVEIAHLSICHSILDFIIENDL